MYTNTLIISPKLGKLLYKNEKLELRQLVYKMHRIFYCISNNEITILSVAHCKYDIDNIMEYLIKILFNE